MHRSIRIALRLLLREEDPAWDRLIRRRLGRAERGLPLSLTVPVPPEALAPLPPVETRATAPRPGAVILAVLLLWVLGAVLAAAAMVELGAPIVEVLAEPAIDGLTLLVGWIVAGVLGMVLAAFLLVAAAHAYAGWRIIEGVNWGLVEGLVVAVIGAMLAAAQWGLDGSGAPSLSLPLVVVLLGYGLVVGLLVWTRRWFGEVWFPLTPERAPWWLRWRRLP